MKEISFDLLARPVEAKFNQLVNDKDMTLLRAHIESDKLWEAYLDSFPEEVNGIFRERRAYDCNCCKNFIRRVGTLIAVDKDYNRHTIWDVEVPGYFADVAKALHEIVVNARISGKFRTSEAIAGSLKTPDNYNPNIIWDHFYGKLPKHVVMKKNDVASFIGRTASLTSTAKRAIEEISDHAVETVLELIAGDVLYRGEQHASAVEALKNAKDKAKSLTDNQKEAYYWTLDGSQVATVRNSSIGTLLVAISNGEDLEKAVRLYETMVAPTNYKRTKAVVTPNMIKEAKAKLDELGYLDSLERRPLRPEEVPTEHVLFKHQLKARLDIFDDLTAEAKKSSKLDQVNEISINDFIERVLPKAKELEIYVDGTSQPHFASLMTSVHPSANNMLAWDNSVSWSYTGDVADSIKERVKEVGGSVTGDVRISLSWSNSDDLDLRMKLPTNKLIYFGNKRSENGNIELDVDMNVCVSRDSKSFDDKHPVENIVIKDLFKAKPGKYIIAVDQYNKRNSSNSGFTVQTEVNGTIRNFVCSDNSKASRYDHKPSIEMTISESREVSFEVVRDVVESASARSGSKWGLDFNKFHCQ